MGGSECICLANSRHLGQSGGEKLQDEPCKRIILIAPGWPNMSWFLDLVAMSSKIPLSLPNLPNLLTALQSDPHRNPSNLNLHAWLLEPQQSRSRASLRQWQQELRLLKGDQPDQFTRQSGPFLQIGASLIRWTSRAPPIKSIADFLLHLFQARKLQPSTIDGYRSAIADNLGHLSINVNKDENLTRLLHSFHRDTPKGQGGISSWNLFLVLHQLTKAPFDPLKEASLKHLTLKTVFLLAFGFGKCRSEIHTWQNKNIRHQADWSKVSLYPSLSFLFKNPTLDKSLKSDRSLCPVRALHYYLDKTSGRTRSWYLSPLRKALTRTFYLPLSPHGSNRL